MNRLSHLSPPNLLTAPNLPTPSSGVITPSSYGTPSTAPSTPERSPNSPPPLSLDIEERIGAAGNAALETAIFQRLASLRSMLRSRNWVALDTTVSQLENTCSADFVLNSIKEDLDTTLKEITSLGKESAERRNAFEKITALLGQSDTFHEILERLVREYCATSQYDDLPYPHLELIQELLSKSPADQKIMDLRSLVVGKAIQNYASVDKIVELAATGPTSFLSSQIKHGPLITRAEYLQNRIIFIDRLKNNFSSVDVEKFDQILKHTPKCLTEEDALTIFKPMYEAIWIKREAKTSISEHIAQCGPTAKMMRVFETVSVYTPAGRQALNPGVDRD